MREFRFKCRMVDIEHSCAYKDGTEPSHPEDLFRFVENVLRLSKGLEFCGTILSQANNYQVNMNDFDTAWIGRMTKGSSWTARTLPKVRKIKLDSASKKFIAINQNLPDIKPDSVLTDGNVTVVVEIERSNRKNIWFDFVKIMLLTGQKAADFGILLVPRNYAHRRGIWNLFDEARYYRWCLIRFANVDSQLFSKVAIIGYTQQVLIDGSWLDLDSRLMAHIKRQAEVYLSHR